MLRKRGDENIEGNAIFRCGAASDLRVLLHFVVRGNTGLSSLTFRIVSVKMFDGMSSYVVLNDVKVGEKFRRFPTLFELSIRSRNEAAICHQAVSNK